MLCSSIAAIEASRTGRLGDIVATIQGEQDEIIRAPMPGVLLVQGGPGTGKTVVALHRDESGGGFGGIFAGELTKQAAGGHRHGRLDPCGLEDGWGEIAEVDEGVHPAARVLDPLRPADGEWDAGAGVVEAGLGAGEGHAVVAGHDDDGVV